MDPINQIQDSYYGPPELTEEDLQRIAAERQASEADFQQLQQELSDEPEEVESQQQQTQPEQQTKPEQQTAQDQGQEQQQDGEGFNYIDSVKDYAQNLPRNLAEQIAAPAVGLLDWGTDLANFIPGVAIPKVPEFENDAAKFIRNIVSFVGPTIGIGSLAKGGIGILVKGSKFARDPFIKWLGKAAIGAGSGAVVDYVHEDSSEDHNNLGLLKQNLPKQFGWIPDNIATLDNDAPDVKRWKHMIEGIAFGGMIDSLLGGLSLFRALPKGKSIATAGAIAEPKVGKIVGETPESQAALNQMQRKASLPDTRDYYIRTVLDANPDAGLTEEILSQKWRDMSDEVREGWAIKAVKEDPRSIIEDSAGARSDALDELGSFNFSQSQNLDKPLLGVHDLYGYRESGIRSVDNLGVVGASVDLSRILRNYDTVDGSMGSVISDAAINYVNKDATGNLQETIVRGLAEQLKMAGEYSYISSTGKKITYGEVVNDGLALAGEFYGESIDDLVTRFRPFLQNADQYGIRQLDDQGYKLAMDSINRELKQFLDKDYIRAQGYIAGSLSKQVSDMAEGVRLMADTEAFDRGTDQILDRIQYLMMLTGNTRLSRGKALQATRLAENSLTTPKAGRRYATLSEQLEMRNAGISQDFARLKGNVDTTIEQLRFLKETNPRALEEFTLAYELSGGKVDTIKKLNDIMTEAVKGPLRKGIYDPNSNMESLVMKNLWTGLYNSMLSSASTSVRAAVGSGFNLVERPFTMFAGALLSRDAKMMRQGWAEYSAFSDTLQKGLAHAKSIWRKSASDPSVVTPRDYVQPTESMAFQLLQKRADRMAAEGNNAGQIFASKIEEWQDFNASPWVRFGQRAMGTVDGFSQAIIGNWEARSRAFQELSNFGEVAVSKDRLKELSDKIYNTMWTPDGKLTDTAVQYAAGEVNFNLDTQTTKQLSELVNRLPILKPLLLFQKTQVNALKYTASHTPLGEFIGVWKKFNHKFEDIGFDRAKALLSERGIYSDSFDVIEAEYKKQRAILRGRSAFGTMITGSAVTLFMNDRVTGNGTADHRVNKARKVFGMPKRSIKGLDGKWYSYDGFGALSDWLAVTVDIMDNGLDGNWHGKAALRPHEMEESLRAMAFVISASLTDKTFTAALEPLTDMASGDVSAMNRWSASFMTAAAVPNSSLMAEFSRLMYPSLRVVDNNLQSLIMNRTPLKGLLPEQFDWIDGGAINEPDSNDFWRRIANTYLPWKINGKQSPEKEFLSMINYSALPILSTRKYTDIERSEITKIMGEMGVFKAGIKRIMQSRSAEAFRQNYLAAQSTENTPMPDLKSFENLHSMLDAELTKALRSAEARLSNLNQVNQRQVREKIFKQMRRTPNNEEQVRNLAEHYNRNSP